MDAPDPIQTSAGADLTVWLVVLVAAAAVTLVFGRLRLSTIPGYLVIGALIGPYGLHLADDTDTIEAIAELAILLLMFGLGLYMELRAVRGGMIPILFIGGLSTFVSMMLGWPIALAFGLPAVGALAVAMALSNSSTAAVMQILQHRRELKRVHGRLAFGVLLVQDMVLVGMLSLLPTLAAISADAPDDGGAGEGGRAMPILGAALLTVGGVGLMIVLGKALVPRLTALAVKIGHTEGLLITAAAVAFAAAAGTYALGLSPALGAFIAGFLLADTPFRHQVAGQIAPMRDLFMAVFFTAVGMTVNLGIIAENWWVILLGLAALVLIKSLSIAVTSWALGAPGPVAVQGGLNLAQGSEFSLVLLAAASVGLGAAVDDSAHAVAVGVVAASLALTPGLMRLGRALRKPAQAIPPARWIHRSALRAHEPARHPGDDAQHVIIAGFGPVGRALAERFQKAAVRYTIVELNPRTVQTQAAIGVSIVYGDVTNRAVLESAGIEFADAVVLTIPDDEVMLRACGVVRSMNPDVYIAARATYLSQAMQARRIGADYVVVEELATAEAMAQQVSAAITRRAEEEQGLRPDPPGQPHSGSD